MWLEISYVRAPTQPGAIPAFHPVVGEFERIEDAKLIAEIDGPKFDWCETIEIRDRSGSVVAKWERENARWA